MTAVPTRRIREPGSVSVKPQAFAELIAPKGRQSGLVVFELADIETLVHYGDLQPEDGWPEDGWADLRTLRGLMEDDRIGAVLLPKADALRFLAYVAECGFAGAIESGDHPGEYWVRLAYAYG